MAGPRKERRKSLVRRLGLAIKTAALARFAILFTAGVAWAEPTVTGQVSLTGMYYTEQYTPPPTGIDPQFATTANLLYADLRLQLLVQRLGNQVDLHLDARVRATGEFDFENKFNPNGVTDPFQSEYSAQGYLGGREYDLREAYINLRLSPRTSLQPACTSA